VNCEILVVFKIRKGDLQKLYDQNIVEFSAFFGAQSHKTFLKTPQEIFVLFK